MHIHNKRRVTMAKKKRRKLSSELEKQIFLTKKKVEFITAIINDIDDEDIQLEYRIAFEGIRQSSEGLASEYESNGVTELSENLLKKYFKVSLF